MVILTVLKVMEAEAAGGAAVLIVEANLVPFKGEKYYLDDLEMHSIRTHTIEFDKKNKLHILAIETDSVKGVFAKGQQWTSIKSINPEKIDRNFLRVDSNGHRFSPYEMSNGELFGVLWCHPARKESDIPEGASQCGDETPHCETMLMFEPGCHGVKNANPLTLFPSLVCVNCGAHGWLENGKYHGGYDRYDHWGGGKYPHMKN